MASDKIELVEKPEYADMLINYVQFHGTDFRKPKEWYPELIYNSKKHQPARISTNMPNVKMDMSVSGLTIISKFPLSQKNLEAYKNTTDSGKQFKIYVPKDRKIKVLFDQNVKDAVSANNRRVGFEQYKVAECYGELISLDIEDGAAIIKVVVRG